MATRRGSSDKDTNGDQGHLRIPNDVWDALCRTPMPSAARQVLDVIIRKTVGWGKPHDYIPRKQFRQMTGLSDSGIKKGLRRLMDMNIGTQMGTKRRPLYGFNTDFSRWKLAPKRVPNDNWYPDGPPLVPKQVPNIGTQMGATSKDKTKDTLSTHRDCVCAEVLAYLEEKTGKAYSIKNQEHHDIIHARVAEGATIDDFKAAVDNREATWMGTQWEHLLRPADIFKAENFESYANTPPPGVWGDDEPTPSPPSDDNDKVRCIQFCDLCDGKTVTVMAQLASGELVPACTDCGKAFPTFPLEAAVND